MNSFSHNILPGSNHRPPMSSTISDAISDAIEQRTEFDFVRYANCWEDADVLIEALRPGPGKRILSIASAGDNALALAGAGATVIAADLNPAQLACLELRIAAFRKLTYEDLLAFLGARPCDQRRRVFQDLRPALSATSRAHWDAHPLHIDQGVIHCGKFENYFRTFRTRILPLIHSRIVVAEMLSAKSRDQRLRFWNNTWNSFRWRLLLRIFFSRFLMARMGRDPEFFRYVKGSIADQIQNRARHALTELPTESNPFLNYIATGNFGAALPRYLRPEHYDSIRSGIDRVTLYHGRIEAAASDHRHGGFDGFNLSDIFEYISESTSESIYGALLSHANPGARFAYWNTFVPRGCPSRYLDNVTPLDGIAYGLFQQDNAFFYGHFQIDEVRPADGGIDPTETASVPSAADNL